MKKHCLRLVVLPLVVFAACVGSSKSSTPLSPAIAGPIAGVGISEPTVMAPPVDARVDTNQQPVTLRVGNAATNGVRPLSYRFEIASDPNFTLPVYTKESVPHDPSGRTSFTLPGPLSPERKYYWRARAEDGANTGPYGATSAFHIFTPLVFGGPVLVSPIGNVDTGTLQPRLVLRNASHSGPVDDVYCLIQISTSNSISPVLAEWALVEGSGHTELDAPASLPAGRYYWRARAFSGGVSGPFSGVGSFRTSGGATGGGGGNANPGKPCGPPYPTTPFDILQCRRSQYPEHMSHGEVIAFLSGSAEDMNNARVGGGPFGILRKGSGNNCNGYSCDIICAGQGNAQRQYDVLIDERFVTWGSPMVAPGIRQDVCEIQ
jgi:hypothetical protein